MYEEKFEILANKSIAVVGSRKFTEYGDRVTQNLTRDLVRAGLTIVSGLALGIDGIAHRARLKRWHHDRRSRNGN